MQPTQNFVLSDWVENHSTFIKSSKRKEEQRGEEVSELMSPKPTCFPVVLD